MDDWQQDWWEILEKTASDIEKIIEDIGVAVELFTDEVGTTIEDLAEQLQESVFSEIDRCIEDIFDAVIDVNITTEVIVLEDIDFVDNADSLLEELDFLGIYREQANFQKNPACVGCQNYHGRVYNGNLLVCGMHPYGWTDENCPDWEEQ